MYSPVFLKAQLLDPACSYFTLTTSHLDATVRFLADDTIVYRAIAYNIYCVNLQKYSDKLSQWKESGK